MNEACLGDGGLSRFVTARHCTKVGRQCSTWRSVVIAWEGVPCRHGQLYCSRCSFRSKHRPCSTLSNLGYMHMEGTLLARQVASAAWVLCAGRLQASDAWGEAPDMTEPLI